MGGVCKLLTNEIEEEIHSGSVFSVRGSGSPDPLPLRAADGWVAHWLG